MQVNRLRLIPLLIVTGLASGAFAKDIKVPVSTEQLIDDINQNGTFKTFVDAGVGTLFDVYYSQSAELVTYDRIQLHGSETLVEFVKGKEVDALQVFGEYVERDNEGHPIKKDLYVDLGRINSLEVETLVGNGMVEGNRTPPRYGVNFNTTDGKTITGRFRMEFATIEVATKIAEELLSLARSKGAIVRQIKYARNSN